MPGYIIEPKDTVFRSFKDGVAVDIPIGGVEMVAIAFMSPDALFAFCDGLFGAAAHTWPDNEYIKQYLLEDDK